MELACGKLWDWPNVKPFCEVELDTPFGSIAPKGLLGWKEGDEMPLEAGRLGRLLADFILGRVNF